MERQARERDEREFLRAFRNHQSHREARESLHQRPNHSLLPSTNPNARNSSSTSKLSPLHSQTLSQTSTDSQTLTKWTAQPLSTAS